MILVAGGTGFVGRHLVNRLLREGQKVRCLVRDDSRVQFIKGAELAYGDITDYESLDEATAGVEKVIHLVGIIQESGRVTFEAIHVEGTRNLLKASLRNGVRLFFYQSALGADQRSPSKYHVTKAEAETLVKNSGIPYIIFRPSLIFGPGDQFILRLLSILRTSPVFPVIGTGKARFQPLYIEDWISCALKALEDAKMHNRIFEFGGPEHLTFTEIVDTISGVLGINRYKIHVPAGLMGHLVNLMEKTLPNPPLTTEQLLLLQQDNICDLKSVEGNFGFKPITLREGVKRFLQN